MLSRDIQSEDGVDVPRSVVVAEGLGLDASMASVGAGSSSAPRGRSGLYMDLPDPGSRPDKSVLVIASRFPPVASVGAIRVRKFVKYLIGYGWRPVVITGAMRQSAAAAQDARRATDSDGLLDLPDDLIVHRLSQVVDNWPGHLAVACATMLARLTRELGVEEHQWRGFLRWRFQRVHNGLSFPDRGIWRLLAVVRAAARLHRRHRFQAIFSSGMPFSDHVCALVVQSVLRRPWVADFRDPWVEYIHWQQWQTEWGRSLTRAAEAAVVRRAACVVSVNDHMTGRFIRRYGPRLASKFLTIQNGFDPADFPRGAKPDQQARFRLLYAGSLYATRSPDAVLAAYRRFLDQVPGSRSHARFEFAGRAGPYADELRRLSTDGTVRYMGMLSHAAALRKMASTDVNVIILPKVPGSENDTTAKVYECLGSGRPVLAVVPSGGAAAEVLRRFAGTWLCDPDDVEGIAAVMADLYWRWLAGDLSVNRPAEGLAPFTRRHQAGQLAACLDRSTTRMKRPVGVGR